jgi:S1-C subfamily serine protease
MNSSRGVSCSIILVAVVFGVVGGFGGAALYAKYGRQMVAPLSLPAARGGTEKIEVETDKDAIVNAVAKASPSVVKIVGAREPQNMQELMQSGEEVKGIGSGVIFDYNGRKLILTNRHVVGGFTDLTVKLVDGRQFPAKTLGSDPHKDLAVVEIVNPPADLVAAPLGDARKLKIGEWVIAMGNPYDYEHTVTVGVVSAKGFRSVGNGEMRNVIQTDAAINQGNSGGPLLDLGGNVVGINYKIFSTTGASVGIGFAIPINEATEMMYFLVNRGPWLGIASTEVNSEGFAHYLGIAPTKGIVVLGVYKGSPAEKAGMQPKDVITAVDASPVTNSEEFQAAVFKHKIGDVVKLTVERAGGKAEVSVTAGKVPEGTY